MSAEKKISDSMSHTATEQKTGKSDTLALEMILYTTGLVR